jgi:fatty acid desaturase
MNRRMKQHFVSTNQDPKHAPWLLLRYSTIVIIFFATYYLQFFSTPSSIIYSHPWLLYLTATIFGLSSGQIACYFVHDGSHGSFTHSPLVWNCMALCHDFLNGCSSLNWFHQHVLGHHVYTNIDGADPDIAVNDVDVRKIRPWQKHMAWYSRQYLYMPLLYCVLMMKTRAMDVELVYMKQSNANIRINPLVLSQHVSFWGGKVNISILIQIYLC